MIQLSLDDRFRFACSSDLSCFNACCRDLNQFLYPYDILRLKNHLGLSSSQFLEKYTSQHIGPESGLPVISFKPDRTSELKCPFVAQSGCRVYKNRPSSCRMYPLARVVSRARESGTITVHFMMLKESHCHGFNQEKTQTVRSWIKGQGVEDYNEMNDMLMEIISLKNRLRPGQLDLTSRHLFTMACYDLDRFRYQIFERGILDDFTLDSKTIKVIEKDDTELLKVAFKWIKQRLFG